jgi:hypothetical protein
LSSTGLTLCDNEFSEGYTSFGDIPTLDQIKQLIATRQFLSSSQKKELDIAIRRVGWHSSGDSLMELLLQGANPNSNA